MGELFTAVVAGLFYVWLGVLAVILTEVFFVLERWFVARRRRRRLVHVRRP